MEFLILIIVIFITLGVLNKYMKNKTSNEIMLIGIEITIVGVAFIAFGGGGINSVNEGVIFGLIGLLIVLVGFTTSIFGFIKE